MEGGINVEREEWMEEGTDEEREKEMEGKGRGVLETTSMSCNANSCIICMYFFLLYFFRWTQQTSEDDFSTSK